MRKAVGSLAAAGLVAGVLAGAGPLQANENFENHPDVRLHYPTPLPQRQVEAEPQTPEVIVNVVIETPGLGSGRHAAIRAHDLRVHALRRALGQRFTGFVKTYRGPRYPF